MEGQAADRLLADEGFMRQWAELHAVCPWGTVLQAPGFARAWYTTYRQRYEPVLLLGHDSSGRNVGLMALGRSSRGDLVMAGGVQAEYQTWLATPEHGNAFATGSFYALGRRYPSASITLKYLPPQTPLEWLNSDSPAARYCTLATANRPMMDLTDRAAIDKCLKRRNIRSRLNKLRAGGYAGIEQVTDPAELQKYFDEVIAWHDFRRVTVSGVGPFERDPLKKQFHLEMLKQGVLYTTVLKMQDQVVSLQMDMLGTKVVHLALGAYAPWLSKFALGKIHILEVAQLLRDAGLKWMDLTPGDDPYKAEFATHWETVHTLTVCPGLLAHQRARLVLQVDGLARRGLQRIGSDTVAAKIALHNLRTRPLATLAQPVRKLLGRWRSREAKVVYAIPAVRLQDLAATEAANAVRFDCIGDWLTYQPRGLEAARHACLSDATRRFADGMQSFTMIEDGCLRFSCWLADHPSQVLSEQQLAESGWGERSALLLDIRTYGGDRASTIAIALPEVVRQVAQQKDTSTVLVVIGRDDRASAEVLEQLGFRRETRPVGFLRANKSHMAAAVNGWMSLLVALQVMGLG